jgi:hypothetical protein
LIAVVAIGVVERLVEEPVAEAAVEPARSTAMGEDE